MINIRFIMGVITLLPTIVYTLSTGNHGIRRAKRQLIDRLDFANFMVNIPSIALYVLDKY